MRKSDLQSKFDGEPDSGTTGKCRLIYGYDGYFVVYAIRLADKDHAEWAMPLPYPTARVGPNGVRKLAQWTEELLMEKLQPTLRSIRGTYGGDWVLDIRVREQIPYETERRPGAREDAVRRVLAGPDTPGKRWLLRHKGRQS